MKTSNKSSIITGAVLLALAALFSISLILQPLDFGAAGPGHNNICYILGNMLYSVYGFSSILIPVFLLISGLSCFATKWTARKTMRLITALIPFFTCVVTENICRSIIALNKGNFSIIKILVALITGAMLVVIEFLGTGILADKINNGGFKKPKTPGYNKMSRVQVPEVKESEPSVFDEALSAINENNDEDDEETVEESDEIEKNYECYEEDEEFSEEEIEYSDYNREPEIEEENEPEQEAEIHEDEKIETPAGESLIEDSIEEEPVTSNSMITQEEFAALTNPGDELEWPDLPPQPETLPPEYDADFDENDPALEFPPKEETAETSETQEIQEETYPSFDVEFEEESFTPEEPENETEEISDDSDYDEVYSEPYMPESSYEETVSVKDDPYATTRYIDSVVENPRFPHGIVIHDGTEKTEESDEEPEPEAPKPKYPTKIQLQEDVVIESQNEPELENDDYVEDETLPFPDFDLETPAISQNMEPEFQNEENFENDNEDEEEENLTDFFTNIDNSTKAKPLDDPYAAENKSKPAVEEIEEEVPQVFNQIAHTETAADVFSEMEADIRRSQPPKPAVATPAATATTAVKPVEQSVTPEEIERPEVDFSGNIVQESTMPSLNPAGANNLTADELSDFFNAQQAENTPKTKEIAANPPKTTFNQKKGPYVIPSDLLTAYKDDEYWIIDDATKQAAMNLKQTLSEFNIEAEITGIKKGPVVTMFEMLPAPGVKLSKIVALQDNIALSLAAQSVRIVAPIPGKQAVGIEVPNRHRSVVGFREIIEMELPEWKKMAVPVVLGKDILGKAQLIDLVKTPHMLIAGATGSGKSVCVNSLILSILFKRSFHDVKMILVDPKVVELKLYNNIPHLLTPVITEPKKALQALKWALCEMERRYALLDQMGVRDISNYNQKIKEQQICTEKLPYIVIIIDEFADLMATSGKELEQVIARLTAMSRAVGIHLVLATQRPSVNVITGLIKANIPTRIAFMVASRTDSNIIIDTVGAEKLLGRGDMLYASAVDPAPVRIQGTFVSDQEVEDVVRTVKEYGEPDYIDEEIFMDDDEEDSARDLFGEPMDDDDPLYDQALEIVVQAGKASASYIQRRLKIGYNRAARLVEEMEERGIVGPANGSKPREVIHIP